MSWVITDSTRSFLVSLEVVDKSNKHILQQLLEEQVALLKSHKSGVKEKVVLILFWILFQDSSINWKFCLCLPCLTLWQTLYTCTRFHKNDLVLSLLSTSLSTLSLTSINFNVDSNNFKASLSIVSAMMSEDSVNKERSILVSV